MQQILRGFTLALPLGFIELARESTPDSVQTLSQQRAHPVQYVHCHDP